MGQAFQQGVLQGVLGVCVAVDEDDLLGLDPQAGDEVDQVFLIGVGGVAAEGMDAGADVEAGAVEVDIAAARSVALDCPAGGAGGLVADEEDVVAWVAEHGFEVVDDASAGAHAAGGDDDGWAGAAGQVVDGAQVGGVVVDGDELFEVEWVAA